MRWLAWQNIRPATRVATLCALCAVVVGAARGEAYLAHPEFWGFLAPWDARSIQSVNAHSGSLSAVVSGWIALDTVSGAPSVAYPDTVHVPSNTRRFALVTSYVFDRFHPEVLRQIATDGGRLAQLAGQIAGLAETNGYHGLVLDFEGLTPVDTTALASIVQAIADSAHSHHINPVSVAVPAADTVAYAAHVLHAADFLLVMLYDQHWGTSTAGAIASPDWVHRLLAMRVTEAGAARVVASFPTYGYEWSPGATAAVISYDDAVKFAHDQGEALKRDSTTQTLFSLRPDSAVVWVSDADLLQGLVADAEKLGVTHFALWRLGTEDPKIWGHLIPNG